MNSELADYIHHEIERHLAQRYQKRVGLVTSYDPKTHSAKVKLQPSGQETGWIPIARQHMGNGWGIVIGLTPGDGTSSGDQVEVTYHDGDQESGRITGLYHSDQDQPPQVQSGEMMLKHQDGREVLMDQAGNLSIRHGTTNAQTSILADGTVAHMAKNDPSKFFYIGHEQLNVGQKPTDSKYALVQTVSGTAINLKAQVTA